MKLTGLHFLLTYQCTYECDHCFVWGSPKQNGTMTLEKVRNILHQAKDTETINSIYFEGGEPFLFYPVLIEGVREAVKLGFQVGIVTNGYWATNEQDAMEWLRPLSGLIQSISISSDYYHSNRKLTEQAKNALSAAEKLNISTGTIYIAQPEMNNLAVSGGKLPENEYEIMYKGRAADILVSRAVMQPWDKFKECPHEDLREPGRVHVDPFGNLHICQGISIGNLFQTPLKEICVNYNPDTHPITGPILKGGPVELVQKYNLFPQKTYADACHLCYESRCFLRNQFPDILTPDQMYGVS